MSKLKRLCLHSLTVAWSYLLALLGSALSMVNSVADALGDPSLKEQISAAIGDARTTGRVLLTISIITLLARLRSLRG